jgi:hypothetical protein
MAAFSAPVPCGLNLHALARVGRVVDVGQIVARHFDPLLLRLQRAGAHVQCSKQS